MGSLVFLVLRLGFGYNEIGDAQVFSTLVSIDTVALVLFFFLRKRN